MGHPGGDTLRTLKFAVSGGAVACIIVRMLFPDLRIDAVTLGLLACAILPWLAPLIKSAELPGGVRIEFQDVKAAADKVTAAEGTARGVPHAGPPPASYAILAEQDPTLALVALRIEIEKRLRALAQLTGGASRRGLAGLTRDLQERGVLNSDSVGGLLDLVALGNQAAHGVEVDPEVAVSAVEYGPRVLGILDGKIMERGGTL